jgi:predicted nucleic acid-binding protein
MRKSVYLDSTIPSYMFEQRVDIQYFTMITRKWWDEERADYDIFTSEFSLAELNRGNYPNKNKIIDLVKDISILPLDDEIINIANIYMKEYVMPKGAAGDAFHLACASFHKIDYLLTWNCNHLANANKEQHVNILNGRLGLFAPKIITPLQLFKERD